MQTIAIPQFARLLEVLREDGYELVGPTIRDGAIVYEEIEGADDLPRGWVDEQRPGHYRLHRQGNAYFDYVVGPQSWKRHMFPPREQLVQLRRPQSDAHNKKDPPEPKRAFLGIRSCELASDDILARVFTGGPHVDGRFARRAESRLVIAVNCMRPGGLCFCTSMGTGPRVQGGYDLCLTELEDRFVVEVGSAQGQAVLDRLDGTPTSQDEIIALETGMARAAQSMGREMKSQGLPELLLGNLSHPRWDDVAARCLSCGNCTQVCPTCFCHAVEHESTIGTTGATISRRWDSCFTDDHGYLHGGQIRPTIRDRYRQWMTHKLGSWVSQFGTSGCVGCGRCIAWCPVGIDITEEVDAIAADPSPPVALPPRRDYGSVPGDPLAVSKGRILDVRRETADVVTLAVEPEGPFRYQPGQFNMLSLPGIGEPPISISGDEGTAVLHTIRAVGAATRALCNLRPGDVVGLRGPFGRPWPLDEARGRNVMLIAGGIGLAPLRGAMRRMFARPDQYPSIRLLYGARSPADIIYGEELLRANSEHRHFKASVSVDHAGSGWSGHVGFVTQLVRRKETSPHGIYMLCGPEVMMRACIAELLSEGVPGRQIYVSMERNMQCAAGFCGRCQYGPYFVCKDGPVFRYDEVEFLFGREGF